MPTDETRTTKRRKLVSLISIAVFVAVLVVTFFLVGRPLVRHLKEPDVFRDWVDSHGILSRLLFVGLMALQVVFAIIPGGPLEIFAGYAFGTIEGSLLSLAGATLGSLIVFLFVRGVGIKAVEAFFPREKLDSLRILNNPRRLNTLVFILFLIPGTPKDLMSYLVGLTHMKLSTWLMISFVARLPAVVVSAMGGDALWQQNYLAAIIVFSISTVLCVVGLIIYNRMAKRREGDPESESAKNPEDAAK